MSIETEVVAHCMIFQGEGADPKFDSTVLLEACARYKDGTLEVGFTANKQRIYVRFPLEAMNAIAAKMKQDATP